MKKWKLLFLHWVMVADRLCIKTREQFVSGQSEVHIVKKATWWVAIHAHFSIRKSREMQVCVFSCKTYGQMSQSFVKSTGLMWTLAATGRWAGVSFHHRPFGKKWKACTIYWRSLNRPLKWNPFLTSVCDLLFRHSFGHPHPAGATLPFDHDIHHNKALPRLVATKMLAATSMHHKMQLELGKLRYTLFYSLCSLRFNITGIMHSLPPRYDRLYKLFTVKVLV